MLLDLEIASGDPEDEVVAFGWVAVLLSVRSLKTEQEVMKYHLLTSIFAIALAGLSRLATSQARKRVVDSTYFASN
jgi:hypothetical protein